MISTYPILSLCIVIKSPPNHRYYMITCWIIKFFTINSTNVIMKWWSRMHTTWNRTALVYFSFHISDSAYFSILTRIPSFIILDCLAYLCSVPLSALVTLNHIVACKINRIFRFILMTSIFRNSLFVYFFISSLSVSSSTSSSPIAIYKYLNR